MRGAGLLAGLVMVLCLAWTAMAEDMPTTLPASGTTTYKAPGTENYVAVVTAGGKITTLVGYAKVAGRWQRYTYVLATPIAIPASLANLNQSVIGPLLASPATMPAGGAAILGTTTMTQTDLGTGDVGSWGQGGVITFKQADRS